jgi:hypothetical protein
MTVASGYPKYLNLTITSSTLEHLSLKLPAARSTPRVAGRELFQGRPALAQRQGSAAPESRDPAGTPVTEYPVMARLTRFEFASESRSSGWFVQFVGC